MASIANRPFLSLCLATVLCASLLSCASVPTDPIHEPVTPSAVKRGLELTQGLAACGSCHGMGGQPGAALVGDGTWFDVYGEVKASNLTPTGLSRYSTPELVRLMRGNIRPDESELSPDVHRGYEWMSDDDLVSIVSYLRSLPAAGEVVPARELDALARNTTGFFETRREVRGYVPAISKAYPLAYGKYLVDSVARCGFCHTTPAGYFTDSDYLGGGRTIRIAKGEKVSPALINSQVFGIGDWNANDIVAFLRTGMTPEKQAVDPDFCPVGFFARAPQEDLEAIARYLKSLKK
jgi:mono/diheme cytochrome c family protein